MQDLLFSMFEDEAKSQRSPDQFGVCALNVQGAPPKRRPQLVEWMLSNGSDVLVLSEVRTSNSARLIAELNAANFQVFASQDSKSPYEVVVAVRSDIIAVREVVGPVERVKPVVVDVAGTHVHLLGVYAPPNGMTLDSSRHRRDWQSRFIDVALRSGNDLRHWVIAGDMNVLEPHHRPPIETYEPHDFRFYEAFRGVGLVDAFRTLHPDARAYSWRSDRLGEQRIDHTFVGAGLTTLTCEYDPAPVVSGLSDHHAMITTISLGNSTSV